MASSSSNPHVTLEVGEEYIYPYPSNLSAASFVSVKLSGRDNYFMWKAQMLCLLESHGMSGFINGTLVSPKFSSSVSGKENLGDHQTHHIQWRRSDALVKGWILGSLSNETLGYVLNRFREKEIPNEEKNADFSAKDVWEELQTIYGPDVLPQLLVSDKQERRERSLQQRLYHASLVGDLSFVQTLVRRGEVTVTDKITNNGNTALHVAVGTNKNPEFLQTLLQLIPKNTQLLDLRNSDGSTLLHVAAIIGNTEAAKILLARSPELLLARDKESQTPLAIALSNMHTETFQFLLNHISTDLEKDALFSGKSGADLLVTVISVKDYGLANELVVRYSRRVLNSDAVPMAIAQNFPCDPSILEKYTRSTTAIPGEMVERVDGFYFKPKDRRGKSWGYGSWVDRIWDKFIAVTLPSIKERVRTREAAIRLLCCVYSMIRAYKDPSTYHYYYTNPILEATRENSCEFVDCVVSYFPNAIWSANEDGHNIIQYAVISRSEKVYNLLYQMSGHKNVYRTIKDSFGNNLLHLAARLAPTNKLNRISGAALQIQRELQWFKEVEGFVCPLNVKQKNSYGETPQMVFTREHKDLVIEGEKWMKATAESYTITAALITTIVFAAAITVPGGNNQETGIPIFINNNIAFRIFAISVAISLFTSATSLLMFLSVLTARFAEQDFLFKLPTKLIIGLATLFISTTAMLLAFGATLYLVFGQSNSRILIPIGVLTCLPISSFVTLQFPLVIDLMSATYGRSIFGKQGDDILY